MFVRIMQVLPLMVGIFASQVVLAQDLNLTGVRIDSLSYGGTGCPQGALYTGILATPQRIVTVFKGFTAKIGNGSAITELRKACQMNINVIYPAGIQYSISDLAYRGTVILDGGVNGVHNTAYYFSGRADSSTASTSFPFTGPLDAEYVVKDTGTLENDIWSPCGASLPVNVVIEASLSSTNDTGVGSLYDSGIYDIGLVWRACTA